MRAVSMEIEWRRTGFSARNSPSPKPVCMGYAIQMRFLVSLQISLLPICAQDAPPQQRKGGGGGPPKNLKILKPEDLQAGIMQQFRLALGQNCQFCHVRGDNASDDNPKKTVARTMIAMANEINAKFPDGKVHVTCFTCHRGKTTPETAPAAAAPGGQGQ